MWVARGCGGCHAFAAAGATGTFGPDLGGNLPGRPADHVREGFDLPVRFIVEGASEWQASLHADVRMARDPRVRGAGLDSAFDRPAEHLSDATTAARSER